MSRIGKEPSPLPGGVKVELKGKHIKVIGAKGALERDFRPEVEINQEDGQLVVTIKGTSKRVLAFWGMTRTLVNNMVLGVVNGFEKKLIVEGVGYRVKVSGSTLTLNVGFSNPVEFTLPEGIKADVDKDNVITLAGIDKELVGQTAARVRDIRKPEPYKGKGIRYIDEHIVRKVGKAGAA
jgi:large subunit ribosomal protein L6